jgi:hypothetical protein
MHSLSLLATENATEATSAFRLAYERGTAPHPSTNGRSPRVPRAFDHGKLRLD